MMIVVFPTKRIAQVLNCNETTYIIHSIVKYKVHHMNNRTAYSFDVQLITNADGIRYIVLLYVVN